MLIKQNQLLGEATAFLDTLYRIALDENQYPARMVNIRHIPRLGRDLIQLESFLKFGQMNGINDGGYAIHLICEANEVPSTNHIAFEVNEANLFLDTTLLETYCQLKNSNFGVYISPISEYSPFYTKLNEALMFDDAYPDYESSPNLQQYVWESMLDDAKSEVSKGISKAKSATQSGAKEVANKLASTRKKIGELTAKASTASGPAKVKLTQQINKLKSASKDLTSQLGSTKSAIAHKAEGAANAVKTAVSNAKRSAVYQFNSAKNAVSGAANNISNSISSHTKGARDAISGATNRISNSVSGIKNSASNAIDSASKAISSRFDSAKSAVSGAADNVRAKFA